MGLRSWWRRFKNRMVQISARWFYSTNFMSEAFLEGGGRAVWQGKPSGWEYETFENLCKDAYYVRNSFNGGLKTFS